ncbi:MAG TPA: BrnT family toxin [Rhizomicrobium sp.]
MEFSGFDWDAANRTKCQKHGVTIAAIESLFLRGVMILPDAGHSQKELRYRAIGHTEQGRAVFVVFTMRRSKGELLIRPISARTMHKKETEHYAETYKT